MATPDEAGADSLHAMDVDPGSDLWRFRDVGR